MASDNPKEEEIALADALNRLKAREHEVALLRAQVLAQKRLARYTTYMLLSLLAACAYCGYLTHEARKLCDKAAIPLSVPESVAAADEGAVRQEEQDEDCDLVVHYDSKYGAGVYAGRNFEPQEGFQTMVGVPVLNTHLEGTIFDDFGESLNETHGYLTLGYALVFNHVAAAEDKMVEKVGPPPAVAVL